MLEKDLARKWTDHEVIPATSRDADIRDLDIWCQLVTQAHPGCIVLTNAYTDVDGSEQNSELAFAVNDDGTRNVAIAQERNCRGSKLV
jgi:dTDP-4-dehydrorhamnose reductase